MADAGEKLKVFISYSRRDAAEFADELAAGLELAGFAPFLDRQDISPGEDWETRLGGLIAESDTVVFVVSPEAVKSERCVWEVDKTLAQSKRLLPVIFKPVPDTDLPEKLRGLQFIRLDAAPSIIRSLVQLAGTLRKDSIWIREHTRLGEMAARWQARGRPEYFLLRTNDLVAAKVWLIRRGPEAPAVTDLQRMFIDASEAVETVRLDKEPVEIKVAQPRSATARHRWRPVLLLWSSGVLVCTICAALAWPSRDYLAARFAALLEALSPKVLSVEKERALMPAELFKECAGCPEMAMVPAGKFWMGSPPEEKGRSPDEDPRHEVAVGRPFAVSRFEITTEEWDVCVLLGGCVWPAPDPGWGRGRQAVVNVSWDDARQYAAWLSRRTGKPYRLLSEAEWEYAGRGGKQTAYSWGDEIGRNNANCADCGSRWDSKQTAPVGSFAANAFGLSDMHGNVWEWVEDCWHKSYTEQPPTDGSAWTERGDCDRHVVRGGSWFNRAEVLRSAHRASYTPGTRRNNVGFRVARALTQ